MAGYSEERARELVSLVKKELRRVEIRDGLNGLTRSRRRLELLVYLIDWIYALYGGQSFTGAEWIYDQGVKSPQLRGVIAKRRVMSSKHLNDLVRQITDYVVSEFGDWDISELNELACSTSPARNASNGDRVILDERC